MTARCKRTRSSRPESSGERSDGIAHREPPRAGRGCEEDGRALGVPFPAAAQHEVVRGDGATVTSDGGLSATQQSGEDEVVGAAGVAALWPCFLRRKWRWNFPSSIPGAPTTRRWLQRPRHGLQATAMETLLPVFMKNSEQQATEEEGGG